MWELNNKCSRSFNSAIMAHNDAFFAKDHKNMSR